MGSYPRPGISGASSAALRMMPTLYIAGESAGTKNRPREFSMPISAAATATRVRNGRRMRVRSTVSSSLPGTSAYEPASRRTSGSVKSMPARTSAPVTVTSAFRSWLASRHAAVRPSCVSRRMKAGTKAALIAPSANRSRSRLGIFVATLKASIALPAPNSAASTWSRSRPSRRLVSVAAPTTPAERASRPDADPPAGGDGGAEAELGSEEFMWRSGR